jgi:hypothetical protein
MNSWLSVAVVIIVIVGILLGGLYAITEYEEYQYYAGYKETGRASLTSFCSVLTTMPDHQCIIWVNGVLDANIENGYNIVFCDNLYLNPDNIYSSDGFRRCLARHNIESP